MAETLQSKYYLKKELKDEPRFSAHHPMLPKLYVPAWLLDIKNKRVISLNCVEGNGRNLVKGHVSTFWCGRERVCATNRRLYPNFLNDSRKLFPNDSPFSKYNSSLRRMIKEDPTEETATP